TRIVGGTATFTVEASGGDPLTYQWYFNGTPITGATDSTLTIPNVQLSDAGQYSVQISNPYGSVTSAFATLDVFELPTIPISPITLSASINQVARFSALAAGFPPPVYQWRLNGINIPGETNATLSIPQ